MPKFSNLEKKCALKLRARAGSGQFCIFPINFYPQVNNPWSTYRVHFFQTLLRFGPRVPSVQGRRNWGESDALYSGFIGASPF